MIFLLFLWEVFIIFERKLIVKFTSLALPMGVFLLLHLYSSVFPSERLIWSLKYTLRFFGIGMVYFVIINFIENKKQLEYLTQCLFIGAAVAAIFVLIQYCFPYLLVDAQYFFEEITLNLGRIRGLFGWPTTMSLYLGTFIPLLISCIVYKKVGRGGFLEKSLYVFLILVLLLSAVLSRSRGWVLGLFFGLITLWVLGLIRRKEYLFIAAIATIIVIVAALFFTIRADRFARADLEYSELGRWPMAKDALKLFMQHPIKGIGTHMFFWQSSYQAHAHNIFLEIAVGMGIPGLVILCWFLFSIFKLLGKGIFHDINAQFYYIRAGVIASLASFLAHNQVDFFWNQYETTGLFWVLVGIGASAATLRE
jgi:O-antigen ligase